MKFIYLTKSFYNTYPKSSYPEIENKMERPYAQQILGVLIDFIETCIHNRQHDECEHGSH